MLWRFPDLLSINLYFVDSFTEIGPETVFGADRSAVAHRLGQQSCYTHWALERRPVNVECFKRFYETSLVIMFNILRLASGTLNCKIKRKGLIEKGCTNGFIGMVC